MATSGLSLLESGFGLGGYIARGIDQSAPLPHHDLIETDIDWMRLALVEAMDGIGRTSPNPAVGAVLVKDGLLISKGSTEAYGLLHAEAVAIKRADPVKLRGATCYVTLEPCGGAGKQAPCADALIAAGVRRVVIAATDPHPKARGLGLKKLRDAGIEVSIGILSSEAKAWHFPFLAFQQKKGPIVVGKWAQTLDGHLADDRDNSQWISGKRSRSYTHWLRQKYDGIMVGVQTVLQDKPRLTARDSAEPHARHPHKIVFDPSGRLQSAEPEVIEALLAETDRSKGPVVYWCTEAKVTNYPSNLAPFSDRIIHLPTINFDDWPSYFLSLSEDHERRFGRPLQSLMAEGGSQLLTLLIRADQLDAAHVFVRTGFLGGSRNRIAQLHRGQNPSLDLLQRHDYKLLSTQQIDDDVLIECIHRNYDFWN